MKKIKYFFNTHTLRFEKIEVPFKVRLLQTIGFILASIALGVLFVAILFQYIDSPKERLLRQQNTAYKESYAVLQERMKQLELQMVELEQRDNEVYRSIFEATPIPDSARVKEMLAKNEIRLIQSLSNTELIENMRNQLNNLSLRMSFQSQSFVEITTMVKNKEKLLRAIPAIQPVSNKNLKRVASGFGYRIDPLYKDFRLHAGLDFSAPTGTPIYATSDGVVQAAGFNTDGYGNKVVINHGYGFQTLYAHMVRVKAKQGQTVKRGEVIGYVGSTGKSTGSHLHYEVIKRGAKVDPVYYFFNDLTPAQFDRLLKEAAANKQSLD
ncbi:MAG: M23 family metallopeptidase [Sediminibacterium sp.]|jgi:murein DD-endopeptidase MepM/ murein hydrolase activator NlpD|nr:M23 family metallopeptidase [Sediminibacterium sp.]MBP6144499.1 M23 family metallopeptidase [Sediminibacterium sp.]